jgi:hypothetical protein
VTDYRELEKMIVKNSYNFPRIKDLLDHLVGARYFTMLDLQKRYH